MKWQKTVYSSLTNKNFLRECLCTVATDRALCCYNCCSVYCKMGPASPTSSVPMGRTHFKMPTPQLNSTARTLIVRNTCI